MTDSEINAIEFDAHKDIDMLKDNYVGAPYWPMKAIEFIKELRQERERSAVLLEAVQYVARGPRPDDSDTTVARKALERIGYEPPKP